VPLCKNTLLSCLVKICISPTMFSLFPPLPLSRDENEEPYQAVAWVLLSLSNTSLEL
jgi:hypothetical protein